MIIRNKQRIMNCVYDTRGIRIKFVDANHIGIIHCCFREKEFTGIMSIDEIMKMSNNEFWTYLLESYKEIPSNHKYQPDYYCETDQNCYYNDKYLDSVTVTTFKHCNIKCKMCMVSDNSFMPYNKDVKIYFKLLNMLKGHNLRCIGLTGNGEPFLPKIETFEYLESLNSNDCEFVDFATNTLLLNKEDIDRLARINNENIKLKFMCSCSAITPETYYKIHNNNNFDKVINNIRYMAEIGLTPLISFVIQSENLHELSMLQDFWKDYNISGLAVHPVVGFNGSFIANSPEYKNFKSLYSK